MKLNLTDNLMLMKTLQMLIAQYKPTAIAKAPEAISDVINKYTNHNSYVIGYSYPQKGIIPETDIVHQHNKLIDTDKKNIIQFHSEPFRVALDATCPKLVIAQYHATLQEYSNCKIVRNPIDLYDEMFFPQYQQDIIRIGYSPSTLKPGSEWADKGYAETIPILNEIKRIYKDKVEIDIITGVPLEECLKRKSLCNIFIDEVKTTSYHRSGLEAMAMEKAIVATNIGWAKEMIKDGKEGFLVHPTQHKQFAECILENTIKNRYGENGAIFPQSAPAVRVSFC